MISFRDVIAGILIGSTTESWLTVFALCIVWGFVSWLFISIVARDWVKLQAEFVHTRAENQIGQAIKDNAILAGTTFFW